MKNADIETLAHHDRILNSQNGDILMVCEPVTVRQSGSGKTFDLQPGDSLRVTGHSWFFSYNSCDLPKDGQVYSVLLDTANFHCVEQARPSLVEAKKRIRG